MSEPQPPLSRLAPHEQAFRERVRELARTKLQPDVLQRDESAHTPRALLDELFAAQLMATNIEARYAGAGRSFFEAMLAIEEIARVDPGVAVYVDVQTALVAFALQSWGSEAQKTRHLTRMARGTVAAYALSEREAGSDGFALSTRAEQHGDGLLLSGEKYWTSSAAEAGLFLVFAKTREGSPPGLSALLVEREWPGVHVGERENKLGIRASSTCPVRFEQVRVPLDHVLGDIGQGAEIASETLNAGRVGIAAQMLGLAQAAFDSAHDYANKRRQFAQPIIRFQALHFSLARMLAEIEASRLLVYNAARLFDAKPNPLERFQAPAIAKYMSSQVAERVASEAIEIFGGYGFTKGCPAEKLYRDAKIGRIYEGTTNMLLRTIATLLPQARRAAEQST